MPDIAAQRPAAAAPIESAWGAQVHDAVEGIQAGYVTLTGATSTTAAVATVTFPRAYAVAPTVVLGSVSNVCGVSADQVTTTGFRAQSKRLDGSATGLTGSYPWIATGPIA